MTSKTLPRWNSAALVAGPSLAALGLLDPGLALLAFLPQLVVWQVLFGSPLAAPQRQHGMDWTSPNFVEVLLSADRGLFAWTPLLALGLFGWLALSRTWPGFAAPSFAVFFCSAWINGGVRDWAAADAFGARRFDLVLPLFAVGVAFVAGRVTESVARRPWLPVSVVLVLATLWNLGLMRLYRRRVFTEAAPAELVAARQVGQLRTASEELLLRLGGPRLRKLAHDFFVGEYLYWNVNLDGTIDLSAPENRFLRQGWSQPRQRPGWGSFRWALYPRACLSLPLLKPIALRSFIRIRTAPGLDGQSLTVRANGRVVVTRSVPAEWVDLPFEISEGALVPGPNTVCFEFSRPAGDSENQAAAAVKLVQLP